MVITVLTILVVISSLLMVGIVLIQKSKGGGLAENFSKGNEFASVKQTTDIVEKITWGLVAFMFVACIAIGSLGKNAHVATQKKSEVTTSTSTTLPTTQQPSVEGATAAPAEAATAPAAPAEAPAAPAQ
ncbi:MAG: preprotein translocase subunit SecG [Paludibacteraceae bacterium]|nr:preprotein translocase subunit SecG [Paludibacteraceae bacterium]